MTIVTHPPDILTDRLRLRMFTPADADDIQRIVGNINVARMTLNIPHPYEDGMAANWIGFLRKGREQGRHMAYAITLKYDGTLTGCISLAGLDGNGGKLGYWIGEPWWGQGLCTEAAIAFIRYAFESLHLTRIHAEHLTANPASGRVMQKAGMVHTGTITRPDRDGRDASVETYEIVNG